MPLYRSLQTIIANANLGQADTIRKCKELGVEINKSTLNKILCGKIKKPNIQTLEIIAKVCNADINKLLLEMDFDNTPKKIQDILINLKLNTSDIAKNLIENEFCEDIEKEVKKELSDEPIADFLISLTNINEYDINKLLINEGNEELNEFIQTKQKQLNLSLGVTISDDVMSPLIPKNSKVTIQIKEKYEINDIILVKILKDNKFIARYVNVEDDKIFLYGISKHNQIETYKITEVALLGKIVQVITDI